MPMSRPPSPAFGLMLGLWLSPAVALAGGLSASDQTRDALFLAVFHHPPPDIPVSSYVLVVVDGAAPQKVKAVLSAGAPALLLEGKPLLAGLAKLLRPEIVQRLERRVDGQGWLSRTALEETGVATAFNPRTFEFSIATDPAMRDTRIQYLTAPLVDPFTVDALRPAAVSGFLNFNFKGVARTGRLAAAPGPQTDGQFATDGALNIRGVVLEGSVFGQTGGGGSLQRGDIRLVYDLPQRALRFTAGDLNYPVFGYASMLNLGGLGLTKDYSLQPHVPTYRTSEFDFHLERPAEVKMWVNNSLVNTLQLPAGAHDIRGLLPAVGQNDISLVIEDSAGRREVLHFSFIYNPTLLDRGRRLFSYNAGFQREADNGGYTYNPRRPVGSASYLAGLTDETTLGAYAQADRARALYGFRALHLLAFGTVQLDTAASRSRAAQWDAGTRFTLTTAPARDGRGGQLQVSAEYLGKNFGPLEAVSPAPGHAMNYVASGSIPLGRNLTGRLSGNYTARRGANAEDTYGAAATLIRRWGRYTAGSVSLRRHRANNGGLQTDVLFGLSFAFSKGTGSFYAAKELESNTVSSSWDSGRPGNLSAPYGFASTRVGSDNREYVAGGGYWGNQGLAEVSYTRDEIATGAGWSGRGETALRLQSTLVFADGRFALTRPVAENFAIVTGQAGLASVAMKVDPDGQGGSRARSDWLSPAVLGDLASYRLRDVRVEPVDPPVGATPEKTTFLLAPTYKSGFLLKLGKEPGLVAIGRLVDGLRQPLAHLPLEIRRLDRPGGQPATTFTSRNGGFQLPDIKPGRYEIRPVAPTRGGSVTVEIPESPDGLYRLGDVVLSPAA